MIVHKYDDLTVISLVKIHNWKLLTHIRKMTTIVTSGKTKASVVFNRKWLSQNFGDWRLCVWWFGIYNCLISIEYYAIFCNICTLSMLIKFITIRQWWSIIMCIGIDDWMFVWIVYEGANYKLITVNRPLWFTRFYVKLMYSYDCIFHSNIYMFQNLFYLHICFMFPKLYNLYSGSWIWWITIISDKCKICYVSNASIRLESSSKLSMSQSAGDGAESKGSKPEMEFKEFKPRFKSTKIRQNPV